MSTGQLDFYLTEVIFRKKTTLYWVLKTLDPTITDSMIAYNGSIKIPTLRKIL